MNEPLLDHAVEIVSRVGFMLVATCGGDAAPHLASASTCRRGDGDLLHVEAWFCPGTMQNIAANRRVALVAWDPQTDEGLQLVGEVLATADEAVLDGFDPSLAEQPMPQVERDLTVRVDTVLLFSKSPHTDLKITPS